MTGEPGISGSGIWAVVPAAGYSSRMKAYKPLLPLGDTTLIGRVIALLQDAGAEEVIVVTGHNHGRLAPEIRAAGARPVFNPDYAAGMFSSVRTGVAQLPEACRGFFLLPADIPAVRPHTLNVIRSVFDRQPDLVVVPEFQEKTGHPPLIPGAAIPTILATGPEGNLREILFSPAKGCPGVKKVPVADRGILMDADRPQDYETVAERFRRLDIPDRGECRALRALAGTAENVSRHMELVADMALKLWQAVVSSCPGSGLDPDLIRAGALLHDICRSRPDHARAGRDFLRSQRFLRVAEIVGSHMDLDHPFEKDCPEADLTEEEVVFLADKVCRGTCLEPDYQQRFFDKAKAYPHARERILNRLETAQHIQARIEKAAGRSLGEILS